MMLATGVTQEDTSWRNSQIIAQITESWVNKTATVKPLYLRIICYVTIADWYRADNKSMKNIPRLHSKCKNRGGTLFSCSPHFSQKELWLLAKPNQDILSFLLLTFGANSSSSGNLVAWRKWNYIVICFLNLGFYHPDSPLWSQQDFSLHSTGHLPLTVHLAQISTICFSCVTPVAIIFELLLNHLAVWPVLTSLKMGDCPIAVFKSNNRINKKNGRRKLVLTNNNSECK